MNNVSRLDFTGQQIYVGMDVRKKSWSISIFTDQWAGGNLAFKAHLEELKHVQPEHREQKR